MARRQVEYNRIQSRDLLSYQCIRDLWSCRRSKLRWMRLVITVRLMRLVTTVQLRCQENRVKTKGERNIRSSLIDIIFNNKVKGIAIALQQILTCR